jgi:hypothetical protein
MCFMLAEAKRMWRAWCLWSEDCFDIIVISREESSWLTSRLFQSGQRS